MSEEEKKKIKSSFVSETDLKTEEEKKIPTPTEILLLIADRLNVLVAQGNKLLEIFEAAKETATKKEEVTPKTPVTLQAPNTPKDKVSTAPPTSRVSEILKGFAPFSDLISTDTEKSAQFVIVKFNKYVGKDVFAKVAAVSRQLGGTYVSKGKDTHFEIPKMTAGIGTATPSTQQPKEPREATQIEDVKMMFPEELEQMLSFTEKDGFVIVKPRQFLGSDNFAKVASIIRAVGGTYVSAGKDSHFQIELVKK